MSAPDINQTTPPTPNPTIHPPTNPKPTGKAVPQWLPERQRRNLAKDENYRRRVELIQDLEFPTASQVWVWLGTLGILLAALCVCAHHRVHVYTKTIQQRIKMSPDGQFVVATGTYPPAIRVYEVAEMSMKFERRLTAEVRMEAWVGVDWEGYLLID